VPGLWVCRRRARQCTSVVLQEPQVIVCCLGHGLVTVRRTGLIAAQTFRNLGCNVVGSAGSDAKVEMIQKIGIAAFNYKREPVLDGLQRLAPEGLNIFFDNVGGATLESGLEMMNDHGRVVLCGAISDYDKPPTEKYGVKNTFHVVAKALTIQGFLLFNFTPEQNADCTATLLQWLQEGKLQNEVTVVDGFDRLIADGIGGLFSGANTGKLLVRAPLVK